MTPTKVYIENLRALAAKNRVIANRGGTRSGKTYSLLCLFVVIALKKNKRIDIVSESFPHLKRGAIRDIDDILDSEGLVDGNEYELNKTDKEYRFRSGSVIRFFSADDWGKVKGPGRDILFINECNRIPYEVYRQLAVRTRETIFLDWNPDSEFWFELHGIEGRSNTAVIHSTYLDNPFLGKEQIAEIESNKDDTEWWKVYGLGQTGNHEGLVFKRWTLVDNIPEGAKHIGIGLDFGFTQDPTAIVDVYLHNGELWIDELCYLRGMTNDKIADELRGRKGDIIADSAEMKSIMEIRQYGIRNIQPAEKGPDSVRLGIQILQRYKMNITKKSLNLVYELRNYKWKEDKITGEKKNKPVDKFNHLVDGLRYVAVNKLYNKPKPQGVRVAKMI